MPGIGIGSTASMSRRRGFRAPVISISAIALPASSALVVGEALQDTLNWQSFISQANYTTSDGAQTIASVVVNYTGDTPDAVTPLAEGDTNSFSITVSDTGGASRTFYVVARSVDHVAPVLSQPLLAQSFERSLGVQTYDASQGFVGAALSFALAGPVGVSIDSATGLVSFDTDVLVEQTGTDIIVTATNSGGAAQSTFGLTVLAERVYASAITGLIDNLVHGVTAEVNRSLTGTLSNLRGDETITHRWLVAGSVVAGATAAVYLPGAAQDLQTVQYAPLVEGESVSSAVYTVRHAPPVAGALASISQTQGTGTPTVDLVTGFTGQALVYASNQPWATVTGATLSIADAVRSDTVTITATNSGGSATVDLSVTISASVPAVTLVSPLADLSLQQNSGDVTIDLDGVFDNATSYSVTGAGASVAGSVLTLSDDTLLSGVAITVTGSNSVNSVDDVFTFTVTDEVSFGVENIGDEPVITYGTGGAFSFSINGTSYTTDYLGTPLNTSMFGAGPVFTPVCFMQTATTNDGTSEGSTITGVLPLMIYSGDDPGDIEVSFLEDGVEVSAGASTYVVPADKVGVDVVFRATFGGITVESAPVSITSAAPSFSGPTDLGSKLFTWLDLTDTAQLYTDGARTTNVSSGGQNVRGFADQSGKGNHGVCPETGITWDAANGQIDGNASQSIVVPSVGVTTTMEVFVAIKTAGQFALLGSNSTGNFLGLAAAGQGASPTSSTGSPVYSVNGADMSSPTRNVLAANWGTDLGLVAHARNADLTQISDNNVNEDDLCLLAISASGFVGLDGSATHIVITEALSVQERSDLLTWFSTRLPA